MVEIEALRAKYASDPRWHAVRDLVQNNRDATAGDLACRLLWYWDDVESTADPARLTAEASAQLVAIMNRPPKPIPKLGGS